MTWARKAGERLRAMRSDEAAIDAVIALVRWMRGDRVERPWRLTRRQRVEMEYALGRIRGEAGAGPALYMGGITAGWRCLTGRPTAEAWDALRGAEDTRGMVRAIRARVAIALRAALRADEDARCEEALARIRCDSDVYGACRALGAVREWQDVRRVVRDLPPLRGACEDAACGPAVPRRALVVPLALWERRPSLWAQSPPTSDARGPR